ncbi:ABC transporter permease [Streptomyces sp. NPDC093600]|uniref:ABC transporter permease n=1 Tax=Streptomyces sp. NPDC093600 TaxID=3366047 RepID=UPI0038019786
MTAPAPHRAPTGASRRAPQPPEPRARFGDLVAAEWLKLRSLRSTGWSLLLSALAVVAFNAGTAYDHYRYWQEFDAVHQADFVRSKMGLWDAFTGNGAMVLMLCAGAMGAVAVVGEYSSGMIRTTFAAVPARRSVMAAKVLVVAAVLALFGAVVAGTSFWLTQAVLAGRGAGVSIGEPGAVRLVAASALLAPVAGLVGMAIGTLLRHSAATMVANVVVLLLLPTVLGDERRWSAVLAHSLPYHAWQRLVPAGPYEVAYPWSLSGAWLVYGSWAVAAAVVTVTAVHRRDQ